MRYFAVVGTLIVAVAAGGAGVAQIAPPDDDKASIWTLQGENASLGPGRITDRYYTNGLRIGWTSATGAGRALLGEGTQRVSVDITQQIFTPLATKLAVPPAGDRPYAEVLMAQAALVQDTASSRTPLGLASA